MGRGRAKAKQTKVARSLKYQTLDTDFGALQRELGSPDDANGDEYDDEYEGGAEGADDSDDTGDTGDRYAAYADLADDSAEHGSQRR